MHIVKSQSSANVSVVKPPTSSNTFLRKAPIAPGTTVMAFMFEYAILSKF